METRKNGFTLVELLICFVVVVVIAFLASPLLNPHMHRGRRTARRICCASNLKQIGLASKQYAMDFDTKFPNLSNDAAFEQLRSNDYLTDYKIYVCPSSGADTSIGKNGQVVATYLYFGGLTEADSFDSGLATDKDGNHKKFGNILFLDGHVTGYAGTNWFSNNGTCSSYSETNNK